MVTSKELLEKLQENHARNSAIFRAEGIEVPTQQVRCAACGIFEPIVFWRSTRRVHGTMHFRCPSGCRTRVRFDLGTSSIEAAGERRRPGKLGLLAIPVIAYGILAYFITTMDAAAIADRVITTSRERYEFLIEPRGHRPPGGSWSAPSIPGSGTGRSASSGGATWTRQSEPGVAQGRRLAFWRRSDGLESIEVHGDWQREIDAILASVVEAYGPETRSAIRRVEYSPEADMTTLVVDTSAVAWRAYFADRLARAFAQAPDRI